MRRIIMRSTRELTQEEINKLWVYVDEASTESPRPGLTFEDGVRFVLEVMENFRSVEEVG